MKISMITQRARNLQIIGSCNLDGDLAAIDDERPQGVAEYVAQGLAQAFKLGTHVYDTRQRAIVFVRLILF